MPQAVPKPLRRAAAFALPLLFAAHAFCFFNLTYSGASLMLDASAAANAQLAAGQFLLPCYWRVRGVIASPLLVGLLCAASLTAACACAAWALRLKGRLPAFLLCCALCVNPALTSLFAASLHTADALLLAGALLCAAVALAVRPVHRLCPPLGACLAAAALALDPTVLPLGAGLLLLCALAALVRGDAGRDVLRGLLAGALVLAVGVALFAAGYALMLRRAGLEPSAALQTPRGGSLAGIWLYPVAQLFAPLTAYARLAPVLRAALLALCAFAVLALLRRGVRRGLAALALMALLPLAVNMPVLSAAASAQTRLSFALLDVLILVLACSLPMRLLRAAGAALGVLTLSGVIFANQVYLKKNLEFESTLSAMTRVLQRVEAVEGFVPGQTPAAIVGALDGGSLSVERVGFAHLSALEAARNHYAPVTAEDHIWYFWDVLGYPLSLVSTYEQALLAENEQVRAMPCFPAEGCVQMVEGTLVIKLSEPDGQ